MRDKDLNLEFERFRRDGDTGALGRVFDRTAPEILKVARHLGRDATEAEDLLQATFLAAIERAETFDASRRLEPWLFGILVNLVRSARRRSAHYPTTGASATSEPPDARPGADPRDAAESRELESAVDRALAALPATYREVVEPRLREGAAGPEIARRVGRTPSVVRSQLHRGLGLLRLALPSSVVATLAVTLGTRRALAASRAHVMAQASAGAPGIVPAVSATASIWTGGWFVSNKSLVAIVAVAVLGASFLALRGSEDAGSVSVGVFDPPTRASAVLDSPPEREVVVPEEQRAGEHAPPEPTEAAVDAGPPASYRRALSGVVGRLVQANGRPAASLPVTLVELHAGSLLSDRGVVFEAKPRVLPFEVGSTETDAEGRFRFEGAHARGAHILGVDLGGPRATFRVVDLPLVKSETTDLGDVHLAAVMAVTGRVVDEAAEPVANARVRCAPLPVPIAGFGVQHFRRERGLMLKESMYHSFFDPPAWLGAWWDRLPIPTATTGADGRFELTGVSPGVLTAVVDKAGWVSAVVGPVPSGRSARRDLGEIELGRGATVCGVVVAADGSPVAGADVRVALAPTLGSIWVTVPAGPTGEDGRFTAPAIPVETEIVVAARATALHPWTVTEASDPTDLQEAIELRLPAGFRHELTFIDREGDPVEPDEVRLWARRNQLDADWAGVPHVDATRFAQRREPGTLVFPELLSGYYDLTARATGFADAHRRLHVEEDGATRVEFERGLAFDVRVSAAGRPVEHARVSIFEANDRDVALAQYRTDVAGSARCGPLEAPDGPWLLRVEHPAHPVVYVDLPPDPVTVEVVVPAAGRIVGHLLGGGEGPTGRYMVALTPHDRRLEIDDQMQPIVTSDADGRFGFDDLAAGSYDLRVLPRLFDGDPFALSPEVFKDLEPVARIVTTEVRAGEVSEVEIDVFPTHGGDCVISGLVRIDGMPAVSQQVSVTHSGVQADVETDARGAFRLEGISSGPVFVSIFLAKRSERLVELEQIWSKPLELRPGETRELFVELTACSIRIRVHDQGGRPVAGATVLVGGADSDNRYVGRQTVTGTTGVAEVSMHVAGTYRAFASTDDGSGEAEVVARPGVTGVASIELESAVPCAGTFTLPETLPGDEHVDATALFAVDRADIRTVEQSVSLEPGARSFRVQGLRPGRYSVLFHAGSEGRTIFQSKWIELELGESGDEELHFDFEPAE